MTQIKAVRSWAISFLNLALLWSAATVVPLLAQESSHADHAVVIAVPPVAIRLVDHAWGAVPERGLGSGRPQVRWFEYVVIR